MIGSVSQNDRSVEVGPSGCPNPGYMDQSPTRGERRVPNGGRGVRISPVLGYTLFGTVGVGL